MLEVKNLTKTYASLPAVNSVSFCAGQGEVTGYLGPNGSGKSTTLKMIAGLVAPTSGSILWRGQEVDTSSEGYKRGIGYVPEEPHLYSFLSGQEYLELVGQLRGMEHRTSHRRIGRLLRVLGLDESRHSRIAEYSKGMKQKLLLLAALLDNPRILILDEPLSGLDAATVLVVRQAIKSMASMGKTVLVSAHELSVMEDVADRVVILKKGGVVANDTVESLMRQHEVGTLEEAFRHLAIDVNCVDIARDLVEAMEA
ncbi:MAG TPA: ABC transporter ATP-binding protein [Bryobacteraceae bacterium]|nr:ABC transporter ATP-binding protein [Bryobacteraceae bacterium]HPT25753.1 ABC transporter ATP-binding protein [Bryobacteraceae bacterium]